MKRALVVAVLALAVSGFTGCSSTTTYQGEQSAQSAVFTAKVGYEIALQVAVVYRGLPLCSSAVKAPCSDAKILQQLRVAQPAVRVTLDAAESAARSGISAEAVQKAVAAAQSSLAAFTAITTALPVN